MDTYDYETDIKLEALVDEAYTLFSKYKLGNSLDVCPCCVFDDEVKTLLRTPLAVVSRELLASAYYDSAPSTSIKALKEMKHFLPRVLQLMLLFEFPSISAELVFRYIDLKETEEWEEEEIALLQAFARLYFKKVLNSCKMEVNTALVMFGIAGFDLKPLLDEWKNVEGERALLHLCNFLIYDLQNKGGELLKLRNAFSTEAIDREVSEWINQELDTQVFVRKIENMLFDESLELSKETWAELDLLYALLNNEYQMYYKHIYY
jgi:hypothetical protein